MTGHALAPEVAAMGLAIGLLLSLACYLLTNLSPGGMITPGWLAISVLMDAGQAVVVLAATAMCVLATAGLQKVMILYGKRLFAAAVLTGVVLQAGLFLIAQQTAPTLFSHHILGFVVPGLIAYQLARQQAAPTLLATATVTLACYSLLAIGVLTALVPTA
ncbi:poly-gamma-glutamate biosynthesis protein PgsC/CapC [Glycomyces tarimensis]